MSPKLSVIMAAYNAEKFITEAIESILNQSFDNFEFLIVDDASTDATVSIIESFAQKDSRIHIFHNTENRGQAYARNTALQNARGEYTAILDADDIALPDRLEKQLTFLQRHPNVTLVGSSALLIDEHGKPIGTKGKPNDLRIIDFKMLIQNQFVHSTLMYRRSAVIDIGMYRHEFQHAEDYDLCSRLLTAGYHLTNMPEPLVGHRIHKQSMTQKPDTQRPQAQRAIVINHRNISPYYDCSLSQITQLSLVINHAQGNFFDIYKNIRLFKKIATHYIEKNNLLSDDKEKVLQSYTMLTRRVLIRFGERTFPFGMTLLKRLTRRTK